MQKPAPSPQSQASASNPRLPAATSREGIVFVISAPSGAGKTSICRKILQKRPNLHQSVSYTTRAKRTGEEDGVDYHFVSAEAFQKMVDAKAFLEWAEVHGNRYGTARSSVAEATSRGADILLDIDVQGAEQLRDSGLDGVFIFILPPGMAELRKRLEDRNTDDARVIERRMQNAVAEIAGATRFDYLVVNDRLDEAVERIGAIMAAEAARTKRVIDALPEEFGLK